MHEVSSYILKCLWGKKQHTSTANKKVTEFTTFTELQDQ